MAWIRTNKAFFPMMTLVVIIALIPLYGILFPPLVDLPEHLLISKLLWEKLSGVSHLDLEVSYFLAYRLFPALMMIVIPFCKLWGISLVYLPKMVATVLMSLHALIVTSTLYFGLKDKSWKSCALAMCFAIPAVVCMYSACWFIGFVNYTLAITLLIAAIFLTERYLRSGKLTDASWLLVTLLLTYTAHPFAPTFWVLWCFSRALAGIVTRSAFREWKRLISLGLIFLPILLYHFLATRGTQLAPSGKSLVGRSPFVAVNEWYQLRVRPLFDGVFLNADDAADSRLFGRVALGLILCSTVLVFCSRQNRRAKTMALSSIFLLCGSSWISEKFIPVPGGAWLAYDYRFSSSTYCICLAVAGAVLIRLLPVSTDRAFKKIIFAVLALVAIVGSFDHLMDVRKAYTRFDLQARKYMAKIFAADQPTGIYLPHSRYHPDGTFLKHYICLEQPDCISEGTTFGAGFVGDLYPVKLRSGRRTSNGPLVGYWKLDEPTPGEACIDSSGNDNKGVPRGTTIVDGKINRARAFNGRSDYIDIPTISIPDEITVAAWVYSDNFAQSGFVVTKNPVNTQWALFFEADGFLKWRGAGIGNTLKCGAPSNKTWHHIAGKQKGTMGSLYIDGVLCASATLPAIGNAPSSINIGRYDTIEFAYFAGRIDEVRIYNHALSDVEITQLYGAGDSKTN